jgi:endonuclease/exonuclease/phosphatase family metal-dependent hydrolase
MRKLGYSHTTDPRPSVPMLGQNDGLAIFSKRPFISQPVSESFTTTGELVCKKGFVHGAVKFGDSSLHVVTTHFDSKKKPKNVKELQVSQMSSALLPLFKGGCAIIAGDFNICSRGTKDDGSSYRALKSGLSPLIDIYDGAEVAPTRRPDTKPWARGKKKGKEGGAAIDHAFVMGMACIDSNTIDIRCTDGTVVSDHLGMEFTLAARG